ncbi:hypothetical protein CES86_1965 [Brucella lupini]|uniref:Uncharacterized protein n=1 Tax=Brucella lupini TaxID=255457 RepID=A0A256GUP6_9HYPH|nr:hypothetical protein CES86_1965 [Brucella lupini]
MKMTEARLRVLRRLDRAEGPTILVGPELTTARSLSNGLAQYHGHNHYSITEAGRAALRERE